ncbi:hypothetical protein BH10ACI1_BH10ACI1_17380 [soil metagenome]
MQAQIKKDIALVSRISAVEMILKTLQSLTDLRVSLVARVTNDSWTACAVLDRAGFGMDTGDQLEITTTY